MNSATITSGDASGEPDATTTSQVMALRAPTLALDEQLDDLAAKNRREHVELRKLLKSKRTRKIVSVPPGYRRVLVVDDDIPLLKGLRRGLLEVVEFVDVAGSVRDALRLLNDIHYDLAFIDYSLANGSARNIMSQIRNDRRGVNRGVYVVLMSGVLTRHGGDQLAREIGADRYLPKDTMSLDTVQDIAVSVFSGALPRKTTTYQAIVPKADDYKPLRLKGK